MNSTDDFPLTSIGQEIYSLSRAESCAVIAMASELLLPLYEVFVERVPRYRRGQPAVREALDIAWSSVAGQSLPVPELEAGLRSAASSRYDKYGCCGGEAAEVVRSTLRRTLHVLTVDDSLDGLREAAWLAVSGVFSIAQAPQSEAGGVEGVILMSPKSYDDPISTYTVQLLHELVQLARTVVDSGGLDDLRRQVAEKGVEFRGFEQAEWSSVVQRHPELQRECRPSDGTGVSDLGSLAGTARGVREGATLFQEGHWDVERIRSTLGRAVSVQLEAPIPVPRAGVSASEISAFEADHQIVLPDDYRQFLIEVGEAPGPGYGLISVFDNEHPVRVDELRHLSEPFPFTESTEEAVPEFDHRGLLTLTDHGGGEWTALVVAGPCRGEMWEFDGFTYRRLAHPGSPAGSADGFARWYGDWFHQLETEPASLGYRFEH